METSIYYILLLDTDMIMFFLDVADLLDFLKYRFWFSDVRHYDLDDVGRAGVPPFYEMFIFL